MPAANGAAADVPVWPSVHESLVSVVACCTEIYLSLSNICNLYAINEKSKKYICMCAHHCCILLRNALVVNILISFQR